MNFFPRLACPSRCIRVPSRPMSEGISSKQLNRKSGSLVVRVLRSELGGHAGGGFGVFFSFSWDLDESRTLVHSHPSSMYSEVDAGNRTDRD